VNSKNYFTQRTNRWILVLILFLLTQLSLGLGPLNYSSPVQSPNLVKFVVIGDSGTGNEYQKKVAHQMLACHERSDYEFVIMVGDNIYPWGEPGDYYEKFDLPYAPLLQRGVKFFAALGNHDVKSGHWKRAINYPGFNMNGHRYYTLTRSNGLAQFFALDTTTLSGGRQDHDQLRWLERELAASSATWKLAYFHHPLYSSGKRHGSDVKMRAELEPLLIQGGVRVVFSGHDHIYERLAPQHGIYYFVTGSAGQLRRGDIDPHTGLTVKGNDQVRHFLYVEIDRNEMRFQAISQDGEVIDSGRIPAPTS
jgi:predicted phosphodiesterase